MLLNRAHAARRDWPLPVASYPSSAMLPFVHFRPCQWPSGPSETLWRCVGTAGRCSRLPWSPSVQVLPALSDLCLSPPASVPLHCISHFSFFTVCLLVKLSLCLFVCLFIHRLHLPQPKSSVFFSMGSLVPDAECVLHKYLFAEWITEYFQGDIRNDKNNIINKEDDDDNNNDDD